MVLPDILETTCIHLILKGDTGYRVPINMFVKAIVFITVLWQIQHKLLIGSTLLC